MRGFWLPIGLRALAIFVLGLGLVTAGRHAMAEAHDHVTDQAVGNAVEAIGNAAAAHGQALEAHRHALDAAGQADRAARLYRVPGLRSLAQVLTKAAGKLGEQPFVLDGAPVGVIQRVQISRPAQDVPLEFRLAVKLAPDAKVACDVTPADARHVDVSAGFRCAGAPETVTVGSLRLEPSGGTRAIRLTPDAAKELATGEPMNVDARLDGPTRIDVSQDGKEKVRIVSADDGASLVVHDADGSTVRISASSNGVAVSVDSTGAK